MKRKIKMIIKIFICSIIIILGIGIYYKAMENTFGVTFYDINSDKIYENIRIINLSDLHLKEFGKNNERLVKKIKELSPDMITISGDMINYDNNDFSVAENLCKELVKIAPTYYAIGNHEYYQLLFNDNNIIPDLERIGVKVLHDKYETIKVKNTKIDICGCSQHNESYNKYAKNYMNKYMKSSEYKLLLVHYPELFLNELKNANIDLALTGHTHGGQMILPFIGPLYAPDQGFFPKMAAGVYYLKNSTVIVNRGLGTHTWVPRINNVPELVVVDLS